MRSRWSSPLKSLFWRAMAAFGTVVVATLLLGALLLSTIMQRASEERLAQHLVADARSVAFSAEPYLASGEVPAGLRPSLPWLDGDPGGRIWLVRSDGTVVIDSGGSGEYRGQRLVGAPLTRVLNGEVLREHHGDPWLSAAITIGYPVSREGKVVGAVFLFMPESGLPGRVAGAGLPAVALAILGTAVLGLIAVYALCRILARPIARTFVALSGEKQRIDRLIEDMAEGVVAIDEERRVLLVNPAAGRALGLPGPFAGVALGEAGLPAPLAEALEQVAAPAGPGHLQIQFACGGEELNAHVSRVGTEPGQSSGAVALLQNVTTETQLRRLRENFVANVSHELRGPLASLSAGVEAMHDGLIPEAARPRFLSSILAEIARLRRIVDDLLELSRLDAGTVRIAQEEFDLQPLCEGLADIWAPRMSAAGLALKVECPHLRVVANYDKVEEVLSNFLDNAVRFTEGGGVIRIFAQPEGDFVRAGVADTGAGIDKEHLPHIWDRFYKVDPARSRTLGTGTGLGLAIVKQLVERLGGEVAVQSKPGEGSVFSFTLVAATDEESPGG